jgi:SPP1 gp7 family putative phage head morphogenesis protein
MRAIEARNVRAAQRSVDRAIADILKLIETRDVTDPAEIQRLVQINLDAWGRVNKRLAIERIRESVRRGVIRSSQLLKALRIEPAAETMLTLVSRTIVPAHEALATDTQDSIAADLRQRLTRAIVETQRTGQGKIVRARIKEEIAGPRDRAGIAASWDTMEPFRQTMIEVYKLNGIPSVTWYTERDDRVCDFCRRRHGKRYRLDRVPEPHPRCRCALLPDTEAS